MRRKILDTLWRWKNTENGRVALLVEGTRRVGKSYIVEAFAREAYRSYIMIDLSYMPKALQGVFDDYLNDIPMFLSLLQNVTGIQLYDRESLIIFDEVQAYPKARQAIKHLVADGRYDYIETGSLVGIMENTQGILLPSEERTVKMYPMDFEEFLWAMGDEMTMPFIRMCFEGKKPMGPMHRKTMELFRQYMIVGGMPQAVEKYVQTKDFEKVDKAKRMILELYRNDIGKYAKGYDTKVKSIFEEIPSQLQRHEKKFKLSALREGARARDYETAFFWLDDAMIMNTCYNTTAPCIGLYLNKDTNAIKCYMADTGLLISHAFNERDIVSEDIYRKIMLDKLEFNGGMVIENIVAQMLKAAGHSLYFFSQSPTEESPKMEIDFLISDKKITSRHNISPIEVKSSARYTLTSLRKCVDKYNQYLSTPYVVHPADYKEADGITYLPLYMCPLL